MGNRIAAVILLITSPIIFGITLLNATGTASAAMTQAASATSTSAIASSATASSASGIPTRLTIPSIGVDANVQQVGLTSAGDLGVPSNFTDTAWYEYGPQPGAVGSAVIDGHVDNGLSLPGVFKHLDQTKAGDDIYVKTVAGTELHFVVQEVDRYPATEVPKDLVFGRTDVPRLNLITCTGTWLPNDKTYDTRLVVYAVLAK